ncbi:MAG: YitT family protein [Bacillota bacterium]|nr:YitT family protein [Bacillota bacterium]
MRKKEIAVDCFAIILGSFILAVGLNMFLVPNEIAAGGVSGIATVLYITFGFPMSISVLVLNGLLFIIGWKTLKKWELAKSLMGIVALSLFLQLTQGIHRYCGDLLIASVFGGLLSGMGVGITVYRGASTGGSDMAALMICRKLRGMSVAMTIMILDGIVIAISGFAFSSITIMLHAVIAVYVAAKVTDFITVYGDNVKQVQIISEKNEEISRKIMEELKRGTTGIYTKGLYTNRDSMTVMCVVRRGELRRVMKIIREIDKNAFVTIGDVREVIGEGFKEMEG